MRDLNYQLKQMCRHNQDGSFATQHDRQRALSLFADQLHSLGFINMNSTSLKPKHVEALVAKWTADGIAVGTIKNRLSNLRWWAEKIGKQNIIARDNSAYGIEKRQYVTNESRSKVVEGGQLAKVSDPYVAISLRLQLQFGLRREESIKFVPSYADGGKVVKIKASWAKGGRARTIPLVTAAQREVLDAAKQLAGRGSLIPAGMSYRAQLQRFKAQCAAAGISHVHGQRHAYAQQRYLALAGWKAPAAGGPRSRQLTQEQREIDRAVRLAIALELGHGRAQVVAIYCGR